MNREPTRYVALLRAINVGGNRQIKMELLTRIFRDVGMEDVRTLIASGNVVFSCEETDLDIVTCRIEHAIHDTVGFEVEVMLRSLDRFQELIALNPFPAKLDDDTEAYVTFLRQPPNPCPEMPFHNDEERYSVLLVNGADVFSVASMLPIGRRGSVDKYLLKTFGRMTTTRNWKTVVKLATM